MNFSSEDIEYLKREAREVKEELSHLRKGRAQTFYVIEAQRLSISKGFG